MGTDIPGQGNLGIQSVGFSQPVEINIHDKLINCQLIYGQTDHEYQSNVCVFSF